MESRTFVEELEAFVRARLAQWGEVMALGEDVARGADVPQLLRLALANEISVSELAAIWMPSTTAWDIKIALAEQAGDEARHFRLVSDRLAALGFPLDDFTLPDENPLFAYLKSLSSPVERIAAGQFALELLAYQVNETFMRYCQELGDQETAELYRRVIQPEELRHYRRGKQLLITHATTREAQRAAQEAATRTIELAATVRQRAAEELGTSCFPGC
ncbi:MAG: ferritin-like domain-containing protein [Acidobacteria bacterium]|nr:MAG: ferritin-like domain-containing protein [Acidobacteriota bacterium]